MTRTTEDSRYAEVNRAGIARQQFLRVAAVHWLKRNRPDILRALEEEAYRRWPIPGGDHRKGTQSDYSFIENVK